MLKGENFSSCAVLKKTQKPYFNQSLAFAEFFSIINYHPLELKNSQDRNSFVLLFGYYMPGYNQFAMELSYAIWLNGCPSSMRNCPLSCERNKELRYCVESLIFSTFSCPGGIFVSFLPCPLPSRREGEGRKAGKEGGEERDEICLHFLAL